jgi:hypothetical protein
MTHTAEDNNMIVTVTLYTREKVECHINSYSPKIEATFDDPAEPAEIDFDHAFCAGVDLTFIWDMLDKDIQEEIAELAIKAVEGGSDE